MTATGLIRQPKNPRDNGGAPLRRWLAVLMGLVFAIAIVGGATRLTGSGLSITEWRPVTGAIPPLTQADWDEAFALYRASPQYEGLNAGMTLAEFKVIYGWEWAHRQLGRLIGLVYALGFVMLLATGQLCGRKALFALGLGLLLGLQGTVGWIMVASGLQPGMVAVAPVKLAMHLGLASLFLIGLVIFARQAGMFGQHLSVGARARVSAAILVIAVFVQIALGGLVAGTKAGLVYNTWPLMDGAFIPQASTLFAVTPLMENFIDNPALVQFNHRIGAYLLILLALWHAWQARGGAAFRGACGLFALTLAQAGIGIVTLLLAVPLAAGLIHQFLGLALLGAATAHAARLSQIAPLSARAGAEAFALMTADQAAKATR